jgi:hypothetical protein
MLEMGIIAAILMKRFQLKWSQRVAWPDSDLASTLRPKTGIGMWLEARNNKVA